MCSGSPTASAARAASSPSGNGSGGSSPGRRSRRAGRRPRRPAAARTGRREAAHGCSAEMVARPGAGGTPGRLRRPDGSPRAGRARSAGPTGIRRNSTPPSTPMTERPRHLSPGCALRGADRAGPPTADLARPPPEFRPGPSRRGASGGDRPLRSPCRHELPTPPDRRSGPRALWFQVQERGWTRSGQAGTVAGDRPTAGGDHPRPTAGVERYLSASVPP